MSSLLIGNEDDESFDGSMIIDDDDDDDSSVSHSRSGRSPDLSRLTPDSLARRMCHYALLIVAD